MHSRPLDDPDAGDDPGRRGFPLVAVPGGQGVQLEEGRARVDETVDPLAGKELPSLPVPLDGPRRTAAGDLGRAVSKLCDERLHPLAVRTEELARAVDSRFENRHPRESLQSQTPS